MDQNNWSIKKRKKRSKKKGKKGKKVKKIITNHIKSQKGGAFGAGMAAGMLAPLMMGTLGKILNVKINR